MSYETGDRFLKYWADCIRETLDPYETFGRISGDKFVVLRSFERSVRIYPAAVAFISVAV